MKTIQTDHFLSAEDVSLKDMDWDELVAWWNLWLEQAQTANDIDKHEYSHGVFRHEPPNPLGNQKRRLRTKRFGHS